VALALILGTTRSGRAEPAPPQVNPIHLQREDAQRLRDLQRALERQNPVPVAKPADDPQAAPGRTSHAAGYLLLSATVIAAVGAVPLLTSSGGDNTTIGVVLLLGAGVTGIAGAISLSGGSSSRQASVQLQPAVTPSSVGLALTGRL
jgi:hypothetical protein